MAMTGEFVGTFMFLYFAEGATQVANVVATKEETTLVGLLYIACAFGFSLATTAWVFYRVSGGLFNPAVSSPFYLHLFSSATHGMIIAKKYQL